MFQTDTYCSGSFIYNSSSADALKMYFHNLQSGRWKNFSLQKIDLFLVCGFSNHSLPFIYNLSPQKCPRTISSLLTKRQMKIHCYKLKNWFVFSKECGFSKFLLSLCLPLTLVSFSSGPCKIFFHVRGFRLEKTLMLWKSTLLLTALNVRNCLDCQAISLQERCRQCEFIVKEKGHTRLLE